jgi:hypothetical protein
MNESTLTHLKVIVERAVRPVRASTSRKWKIREELLAHVSGVFEEELAKLGDGQAALERTAKRFGDPAEVTGQLQGSVPASDAIVRFWEGRPGESTLRAPLRYVCVIAAPGLVIFPAVLVVAGWDRPWSRHELMAACSNLPFVPLVLFGFALMAWWMERSLREARHLPASPRTGLVKSITSAWAVPAMRRAMLVGGSCQFLLLMTIYIGSNWPAQPMSWGHVTSVLGTVPAMAFKASLCVFAGLVFVLPAVERRNHHEEWARLPLELPS